MNHLTQYMECCVVLLFLAGCSQNVDIAKEKAELLRIHHLSREAHFQTDAKKLVSNSAVELFSVSSGKIERLSQADQEKFFADYFLNAKYYEWDDLEPPIIHVSNDRSMGWMIERVKVRRTQNRDGQEKETRFVCAFMSCYEKRDSRWVMVSVASTFE